MRAALAASAFALAFFVYGLPAAYAVTSSCTYPSCNVNADCQVAEHPTGEVCVNASGIAQCSGICGPENATAQSPAPNNDLSPVTNAPPSASPGNSITLAPGNINTAYLLGYKISIISVINNYLVPVLFSIAFLVFVFGIYRYFIQGATSETDREKGKDLALWGIIGFVIILSLWGIVAIVANTLGLPAGGSAATQGLTPPKL